MTGMPAFSFDAFNMTEIHGYILMTLGVLIFLHQNTRWRRIPSMDEPDALLIVERLAALSSKEKNYRRTPENHTSFGYSIQGKMTAEIASLSYVFPFLGNDEIRFSLQMNTPNFSAVVSQFGVKIDCWGPRDEKSYELKSIDEAFLKTNMNRDGFYFESFTPPRWGVDYNHILSISAELGEKIAHFLVAQLQLKRLDSYVNRVQAALNFVQYIPYGVPDFDEGEDGYFGIALPNESLAISYSDCDSKSVMFASILRNLILHENIVLVSCEIDGGGHMVAGVSGLPYPGPSVMHRGKRFLLLETTTPVPMDRQPEQRFQNIKVLNVDAA